MANSTNINIIDNTYEYQKYSEKDLNLISVYAVNQQFGSSDDYIEAFVYSTDGSLISTDYDIRTYYPELTDPQTLTASDLLLHPEEDLRRAGITRGTFDINYKIYKTQLSSSYVNKFWIDEISPSRTELRLKRQDLDNIGILQAYENFERQKEQAGYYPDILLNFGDNKTVIGTNIGYSETADGQSTLLVKLYQPLPAEFTAKDTLWIVSSLSEPISYRVTFIVDSAASQEISYSLRGPNFNLTEAQEVGQTTVPYSFSTLLTTQYNSSSYNQIKSILDEKGYDINIDYSEFENFAHFSSVTQRLLNFKYKLELIESYQDDINTLGGVTDPTYVPSKQKELQDKINNLIEKFDGYEYYLYYESSSTAWPKSNTAKPYTLYQVTSSQAQNWLGSVDTVPSAGTGSILFLANEYDINNQNYFLNLIPSYLQEDPSNAPYELFLDMVGQHFDNIWIYYKDVSERYNAQNNVNLGVSKDVVGNALKALGVKLYTNTNISDNIYYSVLGFNESGSLLPPTGSEVITRYITSSIVGTSQEDLTAEIYKRIYHNIPYLLKTKGTERGLRALINCYGIPDSILDINEYGGGIKRKSYINYKDTRFALAYVNTPSTSLEFPWRPSYYQNLISSSTVMPDTITFRFKSAGVPSTSALYTQSLFAVVTGSFKFGIRIQYNPSQSVINSPYEKYGNISFALSGSQGINFTTPLYLPIFDEDKWWTVMIKRETGSLPTSNITANNKYWLYVKNALLNEEGISQIGFQGSASITVNGSISSSYNQAWNLYGTTITSSFSAYLGGTSTSTVLSPAQTNFSGCFQEFRYWATSLSEQAFDTHVLSSTAYSTDDTTSSFVRLVFRAPLGNNLNIPYLNSSSIAVNAKDYDLYLLGITSISTSSVISSYHPAVTGSIYLSNTNQVYTGIGSFYSASTTFSYGLFGANNSRSFQGVEFTDLVNTPSVGISQKTNNTITLVDNEISSSNPFRTFLNIETSAQTYTNDIIVSTKDIEAGFSPTNVIDQDIINQFGYFNIDDYIGIPADQYQPNYQDLDNLRKYYYQKYTTTLSVVDLVRGIKYLDNSLFKLMQDFVPAKSSVSTGIIIKPGILDRSKYRRSEPVVETILYTGSIDLETFEGGPGWGVYYTASYTKSIDTKVGVVSQVEDDNKALFNGEFGGSEVTVTTGTFSRFEISSKPSASNTVGLIQLPLNPLLNNITSSNKSNKAIISDYSSNQVIPVNRTLIETTTTLLESSGSAAFIENYPSNILAEIQDFNYASTPSKLSKYSGSKLLGLYINKYTPATGVYEGDVSYGQYPVIESRPIYFGYMTTIYKSDLLLPSRSNVEIKYLVDEVENTVDLNKSNQNLFTVQNVYKSGEPVILSPFRFTSSYNQPFPENVTMYDAGFRYAPIMHNVNSSSISMSYSFYPPYGQTSVTYISGSTAGAYTWSINVESGVPFSVNYQTARGIAQAYITTLGITTVRSLIQPYVTRVTTLYYPYNGSNVNATINYFTTGGLVFTNQYVYDDTVNPIQGVVFRNIILESITTSTTLPSPVYNLSTQYTAINNVFSSSQGSGSSGSFTQSVVTTNYISSGTIEPCLKLAGLDLNYPDYYRRMIKIQSEIAQDLESTAITSPLTFNSNSDINWVSTSPFAAVTTPISFEYGDRVHLGYVTASKSYGYETPGAELTIIDTIVSGSNNDLYLVVDQQVPDQLLSGAYSTSTTASYDLCRYIILKKIKDETNIIINYNAQLTTQDLEGIIYPVYIKESVKKVAGNVVKLLASKGLI